MQEDSLSPFPLQHLWFVYFFVFVLFFCQWPFWPVWGNSLDLYLKRPWCWEELGAGGGGDDRGWDGWMASPTRWAWVWVNSRSWWWTGRPGMLWFMGSQRVGHNWATELIWTEWLVRFTIFSCASWSSSLDICMFRSSDHFLIALFVFSILSFNCESHPFTSPYKCGSPLWASKSVQKFWGLLRAELSAKRYLILLPQMTKGLCLWLKAFSRTQHENSTGNLWMLSLRSRYEQHTVIILIPLSWNVSYSGN